MLAIPTAPRLKLRRLVLFAILATSAAVAISAWLAWCAAQRRWFERDPRAVARRRAQIRDRASEIVLGQAAVVHPDVLADLLGRATHLDVGVYPDLWAIDSTQAKAVRIERVPGTFEVCAAALSRSAAMVIGVPAIRFTADWPDRTSHRLRLGASVEPDPRRPGDYQLRIGAILDEHYSSPHAKTPPTQVLFTTHATVPFRNGVRHGKNAIAAFVDAVCAEAGVLVTRLLVGQPMEDPR
jgi:hypothetical protein